MAGVDQRLAVGAGASILPDDRTMQGLPGTPVPQQGGFALVGHADAGDFLGRRPDTLHHLPAGAQYRLPDILGVVLDPAAGGKMLGEFFLRHARDPPLAVEENRP